MRICVKLLIVLTAVLPTTAEAGGFRVFRRSAPAAQVVVQQAIPVVATPVAFVLAPGSQPASYGAAQYSPPLRDPARTPPQAQRSASDLAALTKAVSLLLDRVEALERNSVAPVGGPEIPQIVSQQCGKCHGDEGGGESGISFADIAGAKNDRAQLAVLRGTMPKRGDEAEPIPNEIRQALVAALEEMRR